jgi:hypothetical protein
MSHLVKKGPRGVIVLSAQLDRLALPIREAHPTTPELGNGVDELERPQEVESLLPKKLSSS